MKYFKRFFFQYWSIGNVFSYEFLFTFWKIDFVTELLKILKSCVSGQQPVSYVMITKLEIPHFEYLLITIYLCYIMSKKNIYRHDDEHCDKNFIYIYKKELIEWRGTVSSMLGYYITANYCGSNHHWHIFLLKSCEIM